MDEEFADWLLTQYAVRIIDLIKEPTVQGDGELQAYINIPEEWRQMILSRIKELPR